MKLPGLTGTDRNRWLWAGVGTAGTLAASGVLQAAHMRGITRDPEKEKLDHPPEGRVRRVPSADGTVLHVEVFGPEEGETVVLAHGWTEALRFWTYVIRGLEDKGLRVVAYDLRGHGDSEPAKDGDYAIPRFGEDLEAVLAACVPDRQRAVVAGHSLGAMSIVSWADKHDVNRHVRAAALLNTGVESLINDHLLLPLPGVANALNRTIALHGFLGSKAPLPRFSTPLSSAALRYVAYSFLGVTDAVSGFIGPILQRVPGIVVAAFQAFAELLPGFWSERECCERPGPESNQKESYGRAQMNSFGRFITSRAHDLTSFLYGGSASVLLW